MAVHPRPRRPLVVLTLFSAFCLGLLLTGCGSSGSVASIPNGGGTTFTPTATDVAAPSTNWKAVNNTPQGHTLTAIVKKNGQYVAVGEGRSIVTSPTGANWTARTAASPYRFADLAASGNEFVAVGDGTTIHTSTDGVTWTARTWTGQNTGALHGITFSGGKYVAVGQDDSQLGRIISGTDGISWNVHNSGGGSILRAVAGSGADFVAVGDGGTLLHSIDGAIWNVRDAGTTENLNAVAHDNGQYVAVGDHGTITTSPDGITWSKIPTSGSLKRLTAVTGNGSEFLVMGNSGTHITSTDGVTWVVTSLTFDPLAIHDVIWDGGAYVAVGDMGVILTSVDAITWNEWSGSVTNYEADHLADVIWDDRRFPGRFAAIGTADVFTSLAGDLWSRQAHAFAFDLKGLYQDADGYMAVGGVGETRILTSPDLVTWKRRGPGTAGEMHGISRVPGGNYVAVGEAGLILTSADGIAWIDRQVAGSATLRDVTWHDGRFVAVGDFGEVLTSDDGGATWSARNSGTGHHLEAVIWTGQKFMAVGGTGLGGAVGAVILTSLDGSNWTPQAGTGQRPLFDVATSGTDFVAVGAGGTILTSPDGVSWTREAALTTDNLNAVTWSPFQRRYLIVGDNGTMLQSP